MSEAEKDKTPEELVNSGHWEVEPIYFGEHRGKIYRSRSTTELECYQSHEGSTYRPGDTVYMDAVPTDAYLIGTITGFKQTKRDVLLTVTRFYRPEEVPEDSLSIMAAERGEGGESMAKQREIFSSDNQCTLSISLLRGHCTIFHVKDIAESRGLDLSQENTFFSCVVYNQESTRLASHNGEIRVGPSHQAKLPPEASCAVGEEPDRDELLWRPGQISTEKEDKYFKLARTFRLVLLEQGNIHEAERNSRCRDMLLDDAITTLHRCSYSYHDAIQEMNANDQLLNADANFMTVEDTKKFGKGIKTLGKNFTRISRELLPLHNRDQLVAFYYLWKKSPDAIKPKALNNRSRAAAGLRRGKKDNQSKNSRPPSREFVDYASASENETENFDENKRLQYACHHCYGTESRDWHHAGKEPMLLCTECRLFYKKYGTMRSVERPETVPACLFKRSSSETDQEEEAGVRTRAGKKENGRKRSPSYGEEGGSVNGEEEKDKKQRRISNGKRKKSLGERNGKRRKDDAIREEEEGDDDKKSSSLSPSPSGDKEVKREEEEEKAENGVSAENGEKSESSEDGVKMEEEEEGPTTSNGEMEGEERGEPSDEKETREECYEAIEENSKYQCATIIRVLRRGNGANSCSRTDLVFTATPENVARRKETTAIAKAANAKAAEEERKKTEKAAPPPPDPTQPGPSNAGIVHPMPRMPIQPMHQMQPNAPQDMTAFLHQMARQSMPGGFVAPPQFGFDPRMAYGMTPQLANALMEQNQQIAKMANQRELEALMRRHAVPPFMNGMNGGAPLFNGMTLNGMPAHLVAAAMQQQHNGAAAAAAHDPLAAFARQQHIQQMMAGMGQAAAPAQQQPDMETVMRMQEMMQAMANAQQAAAAPPPPPPPAPMAPQLSQEALQQLMGGRDGGQLAAFYQQLMGAGINGMANGNALQSEMMRRLQHDSFKQQQ